jgi:L-ascorbate metabolism protein UlaG (beta-lactamase superfamily)
MGRSAWIAGGLFVTMAAWPLAAGANCQLTAEASPRHFAAYRPAAAANAVDLKFLGHSSFRMETGAGVIVVTDFNGTLRVNPAPDIVTMNIAHSTHHTPNPDPRIKHVLRGWDPGGGMAKHDFMLRDLRVRNVPTDLRGYGMARPGANSIFVFEVADMCIAHLGHLHHRLTPTHIAELGRVDVLLVPVDGGYTLDHQDMVDVMRQLAAPLNLPMHFFTAENLARFIDTARPHFDIAMGEPKGIVLSRGSLPRRPTLLVLPEG